MNLVEEGGEVRAFLVDGIARVEFMEQKRWNGGPAVLVQPTLPPRTRYLARHDLCKNDAAKAATAEDLLDLVDSVRCNMRRGDRCDHVDRDHDRDRHLVHDGDRDGNVEGKLAILIEAVVVGVLDKELAGQSKMACKAQLLAIIEDLGVGHI